MNGSTALVRRSRAGLLLPALVLSVACADRGASPGEVLAARTLGLAYLEEHRLDEAAGEFQKLVRLAPGEPAGHANLGVTYLRMGRYADARALFQRALELAPDDPEIRLQLATALRLSGAAAAAERVLAEALRLAPDHLKSLYAWAHWVPEPAERVARLERIMTVAPANVAARLELVDALLGAGLTDSALRHLEALRQQLPAMPPEANSAFRRAIGLTGSRDAAAADAARRFHQLFALTPVHQAALRDLEGPRGAAAGYPILTLSRTLSLQDASLEAVLAALRFTDATAAAGLAALAADAPGEDGAAIAAGDYDGDGDPDLLVLRGGRAQVFRDDLGAFSDATPDARIPLQLPSGTYRFTDLDNDGWLDLVGASAAGVRFFRNGGAGSFEDRTSAARLDQSGPAQHLAAVDADHDGDLDLLVVSPGGTRLHRNHLDGTFSEQARTMGLATPAVRGRHAAFADLDGDARIDLVIATDDAGLVWYRNAGEGRYQREDDAGLPTGVAVSTVAVADYDNDGFLDLFVGMNGSADTPLYRNRGDGRFEPDRRTPGLAGFLSGLAIRSSRFLDFDNDGRQDLLVAGGDAGRTARLLHNEGGGRWSDRSALLPADLPQLGDAAVFDPDADGDLDLLLAGERGAIRLLRNDGGNANHFLKVELRALREGSGKNNHFGIGGLLEARVGDLYQMRVVTDPITHFGLGRRLKADVVRVQWTNGVPQTFYYPGSDRDLLEEQTLKGSCAFLYTWDGERYRFVTDIMWRSAIGMPLGLMTIQSRTYAPPQASREYLRVPGATLALRDGGYDVQITEELWEAPYLDQLSLLAVDHPDSVEIFVDEKFVPPGPASLDLHQVARRHLPVRATDGTGRDVLPELRAQDDVYVTGFAPSRYQGLTEPHDLVLDLGPQAHGERVTLFLQGWIFPTDASINVAIGQSGATPAHSPSLQVRDRGGRWRTVIPDIGFPAGKHKTVIVDLTGRFPSDDRQVRIQTNMDVYWDHAFFTVGDAAGPTAITELTPSQAHLHYRGFSRVYRKGGRYGPQWFDYDDVSRESPWRSVAGPFTRYGDVVALLQAADDRYVVMSPGDEITLRFDAGPALPLPPGWTRDFLLYSDGWMKDADLNTATGERTTPLPFHAMSKYPYGPEERFPQPDFVREWLTRR